MENEIKQQFEDLRAFISHSNQQMFQLVIATKAIIILLTLLAFLIIAQFTLD